MSKEIRLIAYHANEDDPKKCSAKKLARLKFATLETHIRNIPKKSILLDPYAKQSISRSDRKNASEYGLVAVDCSWENAEKNFDYLEIQCSPRAIPFVIAANPVNYGKPLKLSTLEAFVAALYIMDHVEQAKRIIQIYKWGPHFLELNKNPLEDYRSAMNSTEVIRAMNDYIE